MDKDPGTTMTSKKIKIASEIPFRNVGGVDVKNLTGNLDEWTFDPLLPGTFHLSHISGLELYLPKSCTSIAIYTENQISAHGSVSKND
jgi:hypothetical protein